MTFNDLISTWPAFLAVLEIRFGPSVFENENYHGQLPKLLRIGTEVEYQL